MKRINEVFAAATLCSGALLANAAPVQLFSGDVVVEYDLENFSLNVDGVGYDPALLSIVPVANGVRLEFGGYLNLYASSYFTYSAENKSADYSALFSFAPTAGNTISNFNITYSGGYSIETPGSVGASGIGMSVSASDGGQPFSITSGFAGGVLPALSGQLSATGEISYVEVFDHFEEVFVGYQQVLDYCEVDDPSVCYYRDEPIYEQVAVYRQEMDLGEATIYLDSITIAADVTAVPLPASSLLFASSLLGMAARRLRRNKTVVD